MWNANVGSIFPAFMPAAPEHVPQSREIAEKLPNAPEQIPPPFSLGAPLGVSDPHASSHATFFRAPAVSSSSSMSLQESFAASLNAPAAASQVRRLTADRTSAAWSQLQSEFGVQKLVWDSLQMSKGKAYKGKIASLVSFFEAAFELRLAMDRKAALAPLQQALEKSEGPVEGEMSNSMTEATLLVVKECTTLAIESRRLIAERLDTAGIAATLPATDAERKLLTELVVSCELADNKLERTVRRLLLLPVPAELEDPAETKSLKRSSSMGATVKATSSNLSRGAPVNGSKKSGSRLGAPVSGRKVSSLLRKIPPPSGDWGMACEDASLPSTMSTASTVPTSFKAGRAAEKVRALARDKIEASWRDLKAEFEVQKMVWESLSLQKKVSATQASTRSKLQTTIEGAMAARVKSLSLALRTMEQLLREFCSGQDSDVLSNGVSKAMRNVVDQAGMVADRSQLAERLSTAGIPATLPTLPAEKKEVEELVVSCKLENAKLELAARQLLLLPIPADLRAVANSSSSGTNLGPAVGKVAIGSGVRSVTGSGMPAAKKTSSGMPATKKTSSRRASSTSGIRVNMQNTPLAQRIREDHVELPFDPPTRRFLEL